MKTLSLTFAAVALLSACHQPTIQDRENAAAANEAIAANEAAAAAPLPPSVRAEKTFRCKDNSLAFVTFFTPDTQAVVKAAADGPATPLTKAPGATAFTAEGGWSMTGSETGIQLTRPGKPAIACHV